MNRQQKRTAAKRIRKNSENPISFKEAQKVAQILDEARTPSGIEAGDKVMIDYEKITTTQQYTGANPKYKEFIEAHKDEAFTAEASEAQNGRIHKQIFQLAEDPSEVKWLFWGGHLKKVQSEDESETT